MVPGVDLLLNRGMKYTRNQHEYICVVLLFFASNDKVCVDGGRKKTPNYPRPSFDFQVYIFMAIVLDSTFLSYSPFPKEFGIMIHLTGSCTITNVKLNKKRSWRGSRLSPSSLGPHSLSQNEHIHVCVFRADALVLMRLTLEGGGGGETIFFLT